MYHSDLVKHRDRMRQIICFDGLRFGSITPMDIDMCIEYHDKAVIFCEYKLAGCKMPEGQQLCLRRLADDVQAAGKMGVVLLCEHNVVDTSEDVRAEDAQVTALYYKNKWYRGGSTVGDYVRRIINKIK